MEELQIAFDTKGFQEYFIKYKINEYKGSLAKGKKEKYYIFESQKPVPENLGTFLLAFLNTNFKTKETCKDFIFEYLYVNLLVRLNKNIYFESDIHGDYILPTDITKVHFEIILSQEEIDYYFDEIYDKFRQELLYYQKMYTAVSNLEYFKLLAREVTGKKEEDKLKKEMILNSNKKETYSLSLENIASTTLFLKVNFNLRKFFTDKNRKFIIENIPYTFSSKMFYDILFITFREFSSIKKKINVQVCQNCKKYFIPSTSHETKYCDSIFKGKRTCKQIGPEKAHNIKTKGDDLLQRHRYLQQYLCSKSHEAENDPNFNQKYIELYERFRKEGHEMRQNYIDGIISKKNYKKWLDGFKIKE